jgi:hypothetical protein
MKSKLFWYVNMAGSVAAWIFIFYGAFLTKLQGASHTFWLIITLIWCIAHPLELFMSMPVAKNAGISAGKTIVMTVLFGVTWWLPLKQGVFKE